MHALLRRHLKKLGLDAARVPTQEEWTALLERTSDTYAQADQDRYMLERSLEQSSKEMQQLYDELRSASDAELQKSLALANAIQDAVGEGIVVCDGEQVLRWNQRFVEIWSMPEEVLASRATSRFLAHTSSLASAPDAFLDCPHHSAAHGGEVREDDVELRDGRILSRFAAPIRIGDLTAGRVICFRDVTEERRVAAQRAIVAERMAAVGQLVASVAHEINNPLAYIRGNVEYVANDLERRGAVSDVAIRDALADVLHGVERVATIVRDLRALSRVDEEKRGPVDLLLVVEQALQMANNQIRHRALVTRRMASVPRVFANEVRLGQVVLNLLVNATQAIPEGRASQNTITVVTCTTPTGAARLEIHDTGAGIPNDLFERIFDPFFTTKPIGGGTGLGLSICKGIVEKLGGTIAVESVVGRGTCFAIELPPAPREARFEPPAAVQAPPRIARRVLVVDDDPQVRRSLERLLRPPHDVLAVATVDEALRALEAADFDVVFCDLMMPDRTGLDMHAELTQRRPELLSRIVFMSGGAFTPAMQTFLDDVVVDCLTKPLSRNVLESAIARVTTPPPAGPAEYPG